jgi:hypothetical protein
MNERQRARNRAYNTEKCRRRKKLVNQILGGRCVACGTTSRRLDADHIDPKTRSFVISDGLTKRWFDILEELKKCQLLCRPCHIDKTLRNGDGGKFAVRCGTEWSYRCGCRCKDCVDAAREYRRAYWSSVKEKYRLLLAWRMTHDPVYAAKRRAQQRVASFNYRKRKKICRPEKRRE